MKQIPISALQDEAQFHGSVTVGSSELPAPTTNYSKEYSSLLECTGKKDKGKEYCKYYILKGNSILHIVVLKSTYLVSCIN